MEKRSLARLVVLSAALRLLPGPAARADVPPTPPVEGVAAAPQKAAARDLHAEVVRGPLGLVVSAEEQASSAGVEILRQGGNAVDAAVATALALAVTWPEAGNLGGGGFWISREPAGKVLAIDFRETAPAAATPDLYVKQDKAGHPRTSLEGPLASGVPGTVAGLVLAHRRGGHLPWAACVQPALRLARDGMVVTPSIHRTLADEGDWLRRLPQAAAIFYPAGAPPAPGTKLRQPALAETLRMIATRGAEGFYRGPTAERIAAWQARSGGLITRADLAAYQAVVREPLRFRYAGHEIVTMPPPSSGVTLAQLAFMADARAAQLGQPDAAAVHLIAEMEKRAFADRNHFLGDPAFVKVPLAELLAPEHLTGLLAQVRPDRATAVAAAPSLGGEKPQTTHFSVIDRAGGVVSVTTTLNGGFGSGEVVPGAGFFMNNEMDDFTTRPERPNLFGLVQGSTNEVRGGKRMLSSMCPSIASKDGRVVLVWGTPGGSTIPTTNFQVMWHVLGRGLSLGAAQEVPRFHQQDRPDRIVVEPGIAPEVIARLRALGHPIHPRNALGWVNAIQVGEGGVRLGVSDPRHGGAAVAEAAR